MVGVVFLNLKLTLKTSFNCNNHFQMSNTHNHALMVHQMPQYYRCLFPYEQYVSWLKYGEDEYLAHREFSFTLSSGAYLWFQSFTDHQQLKTEIMRKCPEKIDIGAVYNVRPHFLSTGPDFCAQKKELVFDIDLTDYDDVRTCCSGISICKKCWGFMVLAVKILEAALKDDFGYKDLLWVYSGRRGIHCWVCEARRLSRSARCAIGSYLQVVAGSKQKKVNLKTPVHPSISRAAEIIEANFEQVCLIDQDILGSRDVWTRVLCLIPDCDLRQDCAVLLEQGNDSIDRWDKIQDR